MRMRHRWLVESLAVALSSLCIFGTARGAACESGVRIYRVVEGEVARGATRHFAGPSGATLTVEAEPVYALTGERLEKAELVSSARVEPHHSPAFEVATVRCLLTRASAKEFAKRLRSSDETRYFVVSLDGKSYLGTASFMQPFEEFSLELGPYITLYLPDVQQAARVEECLRKASSPRAVKSP
jgi:hypothetical protein